jgi:hypothetical protein
VNLQKLTNDQVLVGAKKWADHERAGLHGVLHHLHEVERRRLFSLLKYPSLMAYAVSELKYSEDAAVRRISAMRLMKELPEIETKISSGDLTLSNLGLAKRMFRNRPHSKDQKIALLKKIEGKSAREAQKIIFEIAPELKRPEVGFHHFDEDLRAKLEKVRGMLAHKEGDLSLVQLLHKLCDEKLSEKLPATSRVKKLVRLRDRSCTNCGSSHALEVDHIVPRALGGSDDPENLRLLCRSY